MSRLLLASLVLIPLALALGAVPLRAEQSPGQPGDVYWQLVPNGILADQRVRYAIILLTDTDIAAENAGLTGNLIYNDPRVAEMIHEIDDPVAEAGILFAAAGFDPPDQLIAEAHRCRFWTSEEGDLLQKRINVGLALGEVIPKGLYKLRVEIQNCQRTEVRDDADILIWESGQDYGIPEDVFSTEKEGFLTGLVELPGAIPGGGTGGGAPDIAPPTTGDAGLR
jgi:hypothetical protein